MSTKTYINRVIIATTIVIGVIMVIYLLSLAKEPLLWIFISAFFAIAINPLVHQVARFMPKKNIALATLTVLLGIAALIALFAYLFLAPLIQQTASLATSLPAFIQKAVNAFSNTPYAHSLQISSTDVAKYIQANISNLVSSASVIGMALIGILLAIINSIVALVVIISLIFFMSAEGKTWKELSIRMVEPKSRKRVSEIGHKVYEIITGYVVGNIILSMIFGVASCIVLWALGSPYWLPLGLVVGLIDLIPLVGSTIGAIIVGAISLLSGDVTICVVFAIFTALYVQLENNVLNPAVYSKSVDVSPLIVLVSILIGAAMAGIIGALIAIPTAATLQVIAKELLKDRLAAK